MIEMASENAFSVFFLGAGEGVGEKAGKNLLTKYPHYSYAGFYSPRFGFEKDEKEREHIIDMINQSGAQIVIAGMGSPKNLRFG